MVSNSLQWWILRRSLRGELSSFLSLREREEGMNEGEEGLKTPSLGLSGRRGDTHPFPHPHTHDSAAIWCQRDPCGQSQSAVVTPTTVKDGSVNF